MKTQFLFLLLTSFSFATSAHELKNFEQLKHAIQNGKNIRIVTFFDQCSPAVPATGAFQANAFMVTDKKIFASDLHFTRNSRGYKDKSVFEFVSYQFDDDNKLMLKSEVLEATTYAPLENARKYTCEIGSGVKLFSAGLDKEHVSSTAALSPMAWWCKDGRCWCGVGELCPI